MLLKIDTPWWFARQLEAAAVFLSERENFLNPLFSFLKMLGFCELLGTALTTQLGITA